VCQLACLIGLTCHRAVDWTQLTDETLQAGVQTLDYGSVKYGQWLDSFGEANAKERLVEWLRQQENVADVTCTADGAVWYLCKNGISHGFILSVDTCAQTEGAAQPDQGGSLGAGPARAQGEVSEPDAGYHSAYLCAPLSWCFFAATATQDILARVPDYNPFPQSPVQVTTSLTIADLESLLKPGIRGLFLLDTHGETDPYHPGLYYLGIERRSLLEPVKYKEEREAGSVLLNAYGPFPLFQYAYFVSNKLLEHSIENQSPANPLHRSMVFLSACSSYVLADIFRNKGVAAFFGYDGYIRTSFAEQVATKFFACLADTFTVSQAFAQVKDMADPSEGSHLKSYWDDANLMLDSYLKFDLNGGSIRCMTSAAMQFGPTMEVCGLMSMLLPVPAVATFFPASPGHYVCGGPRMVALEYIDQLVSGRTYLADSGYVGTNCTIDVGSCGLNKGDIVSGTFSGTLGWWEEGHNAFRDPPDATVTFSNGVFKCVNNRSGGLEGHFPHFPEP
jgi:hypothetical protein